MDRHRQFTPVPGRADILGHVGTDGSNLPLVEPGETRRLVAGLRVRLVALPIRGPTFTVPGAAPKPEARELYGSASRCLRAGLARLRAGALASDVEAPALNILRREGLGDAFKMRFGYGVGIGYPPSWLEPLKITRTSNEVLQPGMTLVMHACLLDEAASIGVLVGGTYLVTADGNELLSGAGAIELMS